MGARELKAEIKSATLELLFLDIYVNFVIKKL
jgi:hypothetical protein